jgi:glyoxylase-like metal-dependent hydrolase (beta-lactamase superfamily II)
MTAANAPAASRPRKTAAVTNEADAYDVVKLADGVYGLFWREKPVHPEPNVLIVINGEDVLVVDSAILPSTARRIVAEIRKLTRKPVRYVVNTHWHDDHVLGNFVYREAWPGALFLAHPNTRADAATQAFGRHGEDIAKDKEILGQYREMLRNGKRPDGTVISAESRKRAEGTIAWLKRFIVERPTVRTVLPDVTFEDTLVLHRGTRTIELHYLGRGNTRGDVVVYLPHEKILATGDLVVAPTPFGFGSYYSEWAATLDKLMAFDATTVFLSHGDLQHDFTYVHQLHDLLTDLVSRVGAEVSKGATLEQVQKSVTLDDWKSRLAGDDLMKGRAFDEFFVSPAVERAYHQAKGEPDTVAK